MAGQETLSVLLAVAPKRERHNAGTWCCQGEEASHTARSDFQGYWTSPGLPFFNQSVMMTKRIKARHNNSAIIAPPRSGVNTTRKAGDIYPSSC
jgi:hypothetical protein